MKYLVIEDWNGGLSQGEIKGSAGSFRFGKGLDYESNPDAITGELALVKDSGTIVTDLIKFPAYDPIQNDLFGIGNTGNIYKKDNLTTWSKLQTTANCVGQGLAVFNNYLFYSQNTQLGRYGVLSGSPSFTDAYKTSSDDYTTGGPLKTFTNLLLAGNGRYLATLDDAGVWKPQRLTFPVGWYVYDIEVRGEYAAIAVNNASTVEKSTRGIIFYWDGTSHAYNNFYEVMDGGGISSIQGNQDSMWIFPGHKNNIYIDTSRNTMAKKVPFVGLGKTSYVYPGASDNFAGNLIFGTGPGTSETVYKGIYKLDAALSLNFAYPLSHGVIQGSGVEVGAIFCIGPEVYTSWKNGTSYGVDLLSLITQQSPVIYESRRKSFNSRAKVQRMTIFHNPLLTGESITAKYKADKESDWKPFDSAISYSVIDATTHHLLNQSFSANDLEIQLTLAGSTIPMVHKLIIEYDEEDGLT